MNVFRQALDDCQLCQILFVGYKYTWDNRREGVENTKLVLNRGFLNLDGLALFPKAIIKHVVSSVSNHQCLVVCLEDIDSWFKFGEERRFYFEASWTKETNCLDIVKNSYAQRTNYNMVELQNVVKGCASKLKS